MTSQQKAFTIILPLRSDASVEQVSELIENLDPRRGARREGSPIDLADLPNLHYMSMSIVREETSECHHPGEEPQPGAYIAIEGNVDGEPTDFFEALGEVAGSELARIFSHCEGFDGGVSVPAFLEEGDEGEGTWYVGIRGWTVETIQREAKLRGRLEDLLDTLSGPSLATPRDVRSALQALVSRDSAFLGPPSGAEPGDWNDEAHVKWIEEAPEIPFLIRRVGPFIDAVGPGTLLLGLGAFLVAAYVGFFVTLARGVGAAFATTLGVGGVAALALLLFGVYRAIVARERRDRPGSELGRPRRLRWVTDSEDHHLQNHICVRHVVKEGRLRMAVLWLVLWVVGLAHRLYFNRGRLGGIPSIHFARWLVLPERREVLFFSNYDGSFDGYLGDFIDGASIGLNAIWSNTYTYPRTYGLVTGGAQDEQRFKMFARNGQHRTLAWFAAYPDLSVQNILQNREIRRKLFAQLETEAEVVAWLQLLTRHAKPETG